MGTINSNIELFNLHVKNAKEGLTARGESVNDLLLKLFKGYKATADTNFVEYMKKKEEAYLEGKGFDADELMQLALNKYTIRVEMASGGPHPSNKSN